MKQAKYWIVVASRDHAINAKKEGIIQANHGKSGPLKRMSAGDMVLVYAPKMDYGDNKPCQCFVTVAKVNDGEIFQAEISAGFKPYRRFAHYADTAEADIKPLIDELEFIKNKKSLGILVSFWLL